MGEGTERDAKTSAVEQVETAEVVREMVVEELLVMKCCFVEYDPPFSGQGEGGVSSSLALAVHSFVHRARNP